MLIKLNLLVTAVVFIAFGLWGLLAPANLVGLLGLAFQNPIGETAIRAMYGGFLLGAGGLFAYSALQRGMARFGLIAVLMIVSAVLTTRLVGFYVDHSFSSSAQVVYAGMEAVSIVTTALQLALRTPAQPALADH